MRHRVKRLRIPPGTLAKLLGPSVPPDAEIISVNCVGFDGLDVVVKSESFPEWDPFRPMPEIKFKPK